MQLKSFIRENLRIILESKFDNQEVVDAILDKVSSKGMDSLTPEERHILQNPDEAPEPYGEDKEDYEFSYEEEQEDQISMALSELKFHHGVNLKRHRVGARDNEGNDYHYLEFYNDNGEHIMDLEERVYVKHGGGEEVVGILRVDKGLWENIFSEYSVDKEYRVKVFQKYLGEMFGYDIEKVKPTELKRE